MSSFMKSQGKYVIKRVVKARFELPSKCILKSKTDLIQIENKSDLKFQLLN